MTRVYQTNNIMIVITTKKQCSNNMRVAIKLMKGESRFYVRLCRDMDWVWSR